MKPASAGLNQAFTVCRDGMPPLCTTRPAMTTAGVACTPQALISSGLSTLTISTSMPASRATRSMMPIVAWHLLQPGPRTLIRMV